MGTTYLPQRSAKDQFDKQATHYDKTWNSWSQSTLDWMIQASDVRKKDRLLDIGTGTGFTAMAFAERTAEVFATDVSSGMMEQGRKQAAERGLANIKFIVAPAEKQPFPDASFDIVTCRIAAHHFLDVGAFASEVVRLLQPGGRFILTDTAVPDDSHEAADWQNAVEVLRDPSHVRNLTPSAWRSLTQDAGLDVQEVTTSGEGIHLSLEDWMFRAGCTRDQAQKVRDSFASAPESAKAIFQIHTSGDTVAFTWLRVVLKALKVAR